MILVLFYKKNELLFGFFKVFKIYLILFLSLIPYFITHYIIYKTILPSSRIGIENTFSVRDLFKPIILFFNDLLFNIPKYIIELEFKYLIISSILLVTIFIISFFKLNKFSSKKYGYSLFFGIVLSIPVIMYTGRYHPGLWTALSIVIIIFISDIIINFFKNSNFSVNKYNFYLIFFCLTFFVINQITQPHKKFIDNYNYITKSSNIAYSLINDSSSKIGVIRLPNAIDLMHPVAFWVGNQIYNKKNGLIYIEKYNSLHMLGINIEQHNNYKNHDFSYFNKDDFRLDENIIFKDINSYFR